MDVVLVALVLVGSVSGLFWFSRRLTGAGPVAGEFRRAAPATVAAASERVGTVVALTGVVRVGMTVAVSEATGRDYVARDLRLRPFDGASASATRSVCQALDFLVEDDTGMALVRVDHVRVVLARDMKAPETTLDEALWAAELLQHVGYRDASPQQCRLSVWEGVVAPGDRVQVAGTVAAPDEQATALGARISIVPGAGQVCIRRARH